MEIATLKTYKSDNGKISEYFKTYNYTLKMHRSSDIGTQLLKLFYKVSAIALARER